MQAPQRRRDIVPAGSDHAGQGVVAGSDVRTPAGDRGDTGGLGELPGLDRVAPDPGGRGGYGMGGEHREPRCGPDTLYQVSMISTHFTALSGPLVRNGGRRGVGHLKAFATLTTRAGESGLRWGGAARRRAQYRFGGRRLPDPSSAAAALPLRRVDALASSRAASTYPADRSAP